MSRTITKPEQQVIGCKKPIFFLILTVTLLFLIFGCSRRPANPDALVSEFLRAAKVGDYAAVVECLPAEGRKEQAELRKKDPSWYKEASKEKANELRQQYGRARILGTAQPHDSEPESSKTQIYAVRVANVVVETRPGNFLRMDQQVLVKKEDGRWVVWDFEPAPLTK